MFPGCSCENPDDQGVFDVFRKSLQADPYKPFLIISGHGADIENRWYIGDEHGAVVELRILLERIAAERGPDYYSAILLHLCNVGHSSPDLPEGLVGVPTFYVKGFVGLRNPGIQHAL